jgi:hypothetical protein
LCWTFRSPEGLLKKNRPLCASQVANLDFEARVPVPFSIFPSTYKEGETQTTTETTTTTQQVEIQQTQQKPQQAGPEAQYTSVSVTGPPPPQQPPRPRPEQHYTEEEIRIEESYRPSRPGKFYQETHYHEENRYVINSLSFCLPQKPLLRKPLCFPTYGLQPPAMATSGKQTAQPPPSPLGQPARWTRRCLPRRPPFVISC